MIAKFLVRPRGVLPSRIFLPLAFVALAAAGESQHELDVVPLSTPVHQCWTSGNGPSYLKICISKHGNVVQLQSPAAIEHIARGSIGEGYAACAAASPGAPAVAYYDAASAESGWAEPYKVTKSPPKISRKTADGKLELVQSFSADGPEMDFTVTMTLYNRSGQTLYNVRLDRYADFDVNNTVQGDSFHRTPRAIFASDSNAVLTMADLGATVSTTALHSWSDWQKDVCNQPTVNSPTAPGDWLGRISYDFGAIASDASKTVKLVYSVK